MAQGVSSRPRVVIAALIALFSTATLAHASQIKYELTDLGAADGSNSYLTYLSADDQAAFRSGSFDQWAHPPGHSWRSSYYTYKGDYDTLESRTWRDEVRDNSTNNMGQSVGNALLNSSGPSGDFSSRTSIGYVYNPFTKLDTWSNTIGGAIPMFDVRVGNWENTAVAINDHGQIIGSYSPAGQLFFSERSYLTGPNVQLFEAAANSAPEALNNAGQVVGWTKQDAKNWYSTKLAAIFEDGKTIDLNGLLIPSASSLTLIEARGIDASGRIAGVAKDPNGVVHAYLLTPHAQPVPEPSTLALFGVCLAGGLIRHRWRSKGRAEAR
ncbi:PEP-CTERM sorting domain-containing protein [Isosphaeraceae bacterium EP7]